MRRLMLAAAFALPVPALGQVVQDCQDSGYVVSPANLVEPWSTHSRTFANGAIRIAVLDTGGEPACCSAHLLVLYPAGGRDEPDYRACVVISGTPGLGFLWVDIPGTTASYDPARGLLLSVPVTHWHDGVELGRPGIVERMEVRVNQAAQTVEVE
jgi:hypothetical protein